MTISLVHVLSFRYVIGCLYCRYHVQERQRSAMAAPLRGAIETAITITHTIQSKMQVCNNLYKHIARVLKLFESLFFGGML